MLYGQLFVDVQSSNVFGDQKTFVDLVPLFEPQVINAKYAQYGGSLFNASLVGFVLDNFAKQSVPPPTKPPANQTLSDYITWLWPHLTRKGFSTSNSSALPMSAPFVVPGGRFREMYYWDSYFTMLGLAQDGYGALVISMLDDFRDLIETYGMIPNGGRTYYLSRSQPPFFALMVMTFAPNALDYIEAIKMEYNFWMKGPRVVSMPDGSLLNHYWDSLNIPRDEGYLEDMATARRAPSDEIFRSIRAGAESGWDFSSRWFAGSNLESIMTTKIVPVDLNSLLYYYEIVLGHTDAAAARKAAISKYLYNAEKGFYCDFNLTSMNHSSSINAAMSFPLFFNISTLAEADSTAAAMWHLLVKQGGIVTSTATGSGQQWDSPNGWAPLQYFAATGLENYGFSDQAQSIRDRFLKTVDTVYQTSGSVVEKYNVVDPGSGHGGEYGVQQGFGWTNGVVRMFLKSKEK